MTDRSKDQDYLDELIKKSCKDPEFAELWKRAESQLALARLHKQRNLTQQQVADRMGVARPRVAEIERDPLKVSLGRMMKYASALGVSLAVVESELGKAV